ncbi:ribonuclease H [Candidatus Roizmanbacteria bacterium CG10_big_fil_rev_8_21_14_0_10_39_6]|uniref:Ribonuclease H n=1 Tax=Candidatus Roizmanbacteria bacterium CG10_big_fil_rev_8_21_14_0_10_39_6 TaxID=1974853 RepID=A0A2M8KRU3_9BACT|nr:MAG: ribonuclease H [Candidatus Roizmanbacteria bacterium CG10_big_fil_rev_8_21_14_0_10_39_6]
MLTIYTDGASSGNPGPGWAMWVVQKNRKTHSERAKLDYCTNNEAEYLSVLHALKWLLTHKSWCSNEKNILFKLDSLLVVKQLNGEWKLKDARMKTYANEARLLATQLKKTVTFTYIPRDENLADELKYEA